MQCAKFEQRLQQLLDNRQNVEQDAILREHSRACEACGSILQTQSQLFAGLRLLPEQESSHDLGPRVLDQLRIDQRRQNNNRIMMAVLAIAAALMIALLPLAGEQVRLRRQDKPVGGLALAVPTPRPARVDRLSQQESEDLRLLVHQLMLGLSNQRFNVFEPVDQLASGIRPLAVTFNFAFDTLRRTLPGYSEPQPVEPQAVYRRDRISLS